MISFVELSDAFGSAWFPGGRCAGDSRCWQVDCHVSTCWRSPVKVCSCSAPQT